MIFEFNRVELEQKFREAERFLFDSNNMSYIYYENFNVSSFDDFNKELLKSLSNKYLVYCIWKGLDKKNKSSIYRAREEHNFKTKNESTFYKERRKNRSSIAESKGSTYIEELFWPYFFRNQTFLYENFIGSLAN